MAPSRQSTGCFNLLSVWPEAFAPYVTSASWPISKPLVSILICRLSSRPLLPTQNSEWPPRKSLHLESSVLADKFEFGFMESIETQFEEIMVAEAEGAGEQAADFSVDAFHFSTG